MISKQYKGIIKTNQCALHVHTPILGVLPASPQQHDLPCVIQAAFNYPTIKAAPARPSAHRGLKGSACLRLCPARITGPGASQQPLLMTCSQEIPGDSQVASSNQAACDDEKAEIK